MVSPFPQYFSFLLRFYFRIKQNLNEVENLYFRHSRKSRPETEQDEPLERGEMRLLMNTPKSENGISSPSIRSPMDEGAIIEEPAIRPPSDDHSRNRQTLTPSVPTEETISTTPDSEGPDFHQQSISRPSFLHTTQPPASQGLFPQPTLTSVDGSVGSSSGSTLTYDSFWSSHSSSSLNYRSRLSDSSAPSKPLLTTSFTNAHKSNPIIPTLSFPSSPPSSISMHTAMGSFHHADLALVGQENRSFFPPQP